MLDIYLEQEAKKTKTAQAEAVRLEFLKKLPMQELQKVAMEGLLKNPCGPWVNNFQGSPLFEQAVAIEQEDIQLQMEQNQRRAEDKEFWAMQDTICLKKKLLELELARQQEQQSQMAQQVAAQTAMAAPPVAEEAPAPKKEAANLAAISSIGSKALNFAKANPGLVAGAVGGGLLGASQGEGVSGKLMGGLAGAAGGAALGGAAQVGLGAAKVMRQNPSRSVGSAIRRSYNSQVAQGAQALGVAPTQASKVMFKK